MTEIREVERFEQLPLEGFVEPSRSIGRRFMINLTLYGQIILAALRDPNGRKAPYHSLVDINRNRIGWTPDYAEVLAARKGWMPL